MRSLLAVLAIAAAAAATGPCGSNPKLPDADALGQGFDIVKGLALSEPIVELSYNLGRGFHHPYSGQVYCAPDQTNILTDPRLDMISTMYASAAEVAHAKARSMGINLGISVLGLSDEVSKANSYLNDGASMYARLQQDFKIYDAAFNVPPSKLPLTTLFNQSVSKLPAKYDSTIYQEFVDTFGTHVVMRGEFGGQVVMRAAVEASYTEQQASSSASMNGQLQFHTAKGDATIDGTLFSRTSSSSQYQAAANENFAVQYLGGDPSIGSSGKLTAWRQWMESVKQLPVRINQRLVNVTDFFEDPTLKANMMNHISGYLRAHGDIPGPVVPKVTTFPVGPCACQTMGDKESCPSGYNTVAMELHNDNPSARGMVCCDMCDTYAPDPKHGFPPAFGAVTTDPSKGVAEKLRNAAASDIEAVRAPTPIKGTGEFCPLPSTGTVFPKELCVPGTGWVGTGISLLTGLPANFRVVEMEYTQGNSWQDPFSNNTYALGNDMAVSRSSSQKAQLTSEVFGSQNGYSHSISHNLGFQADPMFGNTSAFGSLNAYVQNSEQVFAGARGVVAKGIGEISLYQVQLPPAYLTNNTAGFAAAVDLLPTKYDEEAIWDFLFKYGTHVVTSATLGGRATVNGFVDQVYYSGHSSSDIGGSMEATWNWFKLGLNFNGSSSSSFKDFQSSSSSYLTLEGGDFDSATIANQLYSKWVDSISRGPVPVSMQTSRISEFIADAGKSGLVDKAIDALIKKYNQITPAVTTAAIERGQTFETDIHHGDRCYKHGIAALYGYSKTCSAEDVYCENEKCSDPKWGAAGKSYAAPGQPIIERQPLAIHKTFTEKSGACPPGSYNTGFENTYDGYFGHYDKLPIKCAQYGYEVTVDKQ